MNAGGDISFDSRFFSKYTTLKYFKSKGASGSVYGPIKWKKMQLALKQVLYADGKVTDQLKRDIKVKKQIWTSLEHANLLKIYSVDLNQLPKAMYIVMEFAHGDSLCKILRSLGSENKLPIVVVTDWATQIAEGVHYLHQKNIVHRDLKSSNILLTEPFDDGNPRQKMTLKIGDFDDVKEHDHTTTMSFVGTLAYMAPEVISSERFSKGSDVWSFGVLMWEMISGKIPHKGLELSTLFYKSSRGELNNLSVEQSFPEDYKLMLTSGKAEGTNDEPSDSVAIRSKRQSMINTLSDLSQGHSDVDELDGLVTQVFAAEDKFQMRKSLLASIIDSEQDYVAVLDCLLQYMQTFKNVADTADCMLSLADIDAIFLKVPDLHRIHYIFIHALRPRVEKWSNEQEVAEIFHQLAEEEYRIAPAFLKNHQTSINTLRKCCLKNAPFCWLTKDIDVKSADKAVMIRGTLEELLYMPVVRIQRNILVLQDLINYTPPRHADYNLLQKAQKVAQKILSDLEMPHRKDTRLR